MGNLTKEKLGQVIVGMAASFDADLFSKKDTDLEEYWHFNWDEAKTKAENTYQFYDLLKLYGSFCRRWEEEKNGGCCVVERVRDKYLMPKINEFVNSILSN